MTWLDNLKIRAKNLKRDTFALFFAYRDPRTPWYARMFAGLVAAYLLSPIDLIPDFIPILGYLDDVIIAPAGIALALKMIPSEVMADSRQKAELELANGKPVNRVAAVVVVLIWIIVLFFLARWVISWFRS
jgi:uncharacterized membrane protein YkvA (DUF1232 family)